MEEKKTQDVFLEKVIAISHTLQDLTSRIDERVNFLLEHQSELENNIKSLVVGQNNILERVISLEAKNLDKLVAEINTSRDIGQTALNKLISLEDKIKSIENINTNIGIRLMGILDVVVKTLIAGVLGFVLYKIGINPLFLK